MTRHHTGIKAQSVIFLQDGRAPEKWDDDPNEPNYTCEDFIADALESGWPIFRLGKTVYVFDTQPKQQVSE